VRGGVGWGIRIRT